MAAGRILVVDDGQVLRGLTAAPKAAVLALPDAVVLDLLLPDGTRRRGVPAPARVAEVPIAAVSARR